MRLGGESAAVRAYLVVALLTGGCGRETLQRPAVATPENTPASARIASNPRVLFAEAIALAERRDDDAARARFLTLLDSYPALEDYHLAWLAELAERGRRYDEAARFDDRLLATHPDSVWIPRALARRARVALALGDPRAADFAARTLATAGVDNDSRGYALLVQADMRAHDDPNGAYELYQQVRKLRGSAAALARDHATALEQTVPRLLDDPALAVAEGRVLIVEGRLDLAATRLAAAAAAAAPGARGDALRALARTQQLEGKLEEALDTYRAAALDEGPGGMAAFDLATTLWNRDRDEEARTIFEQILHAAPAHPKRDAIHYSLGRIAEDEGNEAIADAHYRHVVASAADADLVRDARWRVAWMPYAAGRYAEAVTAFADLARAADAERVAGLYWQGRARAQLGDTAGGRRALEEALAMAPETYYAELAEHRLDVAAPPPAPPAPLTGDAPPSLTFRAYHWSRSEELRDAGLERLAARELDALARELPGNGESEPFLLEAYRRVEAPTRALRLATRMEKTGALPDAMLASYLYPRAYWRLVSDEAAEQRLDPYLVLALVRQESVFDPEAASPAAAFGLMQLLGRTASGIAGTELRPRDLLQPATNVHLGTRHLRDLLDRYDGNTAKALAAYNAGDEAVAKWQSRHPDAELDEFVENISYRETRRYVKAVLANYRRYRRLYGSPGEVRALDLEPTPTRDLGQ